MLWKNPNEFFGQPNIFLLLLWVQSLSRVQYFSTPWTVGSSVFHYLSEFAQSHVH